MNYDNFYFLAHAFDLIGRRLFPEKWSGNELGYPDRPSPDEVAKTRAELEEQERSLQGLRRDLNMKLESENASNLADEIRAEIIVIDEELNKVFNTLQWTPKSDDNYKKSYEEIRRRDAVTNELSRLLKAETLHLYRHSGGRIEWRRVHDQPGFRLNAEKSYALLPETEGGLGQRLVSALVSKKDLDAWLDEHFPIITDPNSKTAKTQKIKMWVNEITVAGGIIKREDFFKKANEFGVTDYAATPIWQEIDSLYKHRGRPKDKREKVEEP